MKTWKRPVLQMVSFKELTEIVRGSARSCLFTHTFR